MKRRACLLGLASAWAGLTAAPLSVRAASSESIRVLQAFVREVRSGRAAFEQTVRSPDGASTRRSSGRFAFVRPGRFRFDYERPFAQTIVADGRKVWMHDPDLDQVTVRDQLKLLGHTPAALLAGEAIETAFELSEQPGRDGAQWVRATPRAADGGFQWMEVGLADGLPVALEVLDAFGQRSSLRFVRFEANVALDDALFRFEVPRGTDVLEQ